jgi:hypothetical protein
MQLSTVLSHASVSGFDKSKLDLDDSERVLDLGTDSGFERLKLLRDAILGRVSRCRSHSKVPVVALFGLVHLGVSRPAAFFVELGASMIVASRIVPLDRPSPLLKRYWLIRAKICSVSLLASSGCRKFRMIVSSGIEPLPRENPANRHMEGIS